MFFFDLKWILEKRNAAHGIVAETGKFAELLWTFRLCKITKTFPKVNRVIDI